MNKQTVLVLGDSLFGYSGVANQLKHVCKKLVQKGDSVVALGPESGVPFNSVRELKFPTGETVKVYAGPTTKEGKGVFDHMPQIMEIVEREKVTVLLIQTDPHNYYGIWNNVIYFRSLNIPIVYISVWDTYMTNVPGGIKHWNSAIYENCDVITVESRQTEWFTNEIMKSVPDSYRKPIVLYCGAGSDPEVFKPLPDEELVEARKKHGVDQDWFVVLMSGQNQIRKKQGDVIEAWREFFDSLTTEQKRKAALIIHGSLISPVGYDIGAIISARAPNCNIILSHGIASESELNKVFNISSVVINVSNAAGFELSVNEGMLAGKCIIANSTGGLVDQCGFVDGNNQPIPWTMEFKRNLEKYRHGRWVKWLKNQRTVIGSAVGTPYLFDENAAIEDIAMAMSYWHIMPAGLRKQYGMEGRQWCLEQGLNSNTFSDKVLHAIETAVTQYKPHKLFNLYSI